MERQKEDIFHKTVTQECMLTARSCSILGSYDLMLCNTDFRIELSPLIFFKCDPPLYFSI